MIDLITTSLSYFNYTSEQISINGNLLTFNANKNICIVGIPNEKIVYVYTIVKNEWKLTYTYQQDKSLLPSNDYKLTAITMDSTADTVVLGFVNLSGEDKGACIVLSLKDDFLIENTMLIPSDNKLPMFGSQVRLSKSGEILLVSSPDFTLEDGTLLNGAVFIYKRDNSSEYPSYGLVTMAMPDDTLNVEDFGYATAVSENDKLIVILGHHATYEDDIRNDEIVLSVIGLDSPIEIFTGIKVNSNFKYFVSILTNNNIVITGVQYYMVSGKFSEQVEATFSSRHEIIYQIENNQVKFFHNSKPNATTALEFEKMHTASESIKQEVPKLPSVDTDQLKNDKDKTLLRHHLIIQNLMNNIALSIKDNKPVNFKIKGMEITPDRIKINGLEFSNKEL